MTAPKWAIALLDYLAPIDQADNVVGDLNEMHARRVRRAGHFIATLVTTFDTIYMAGAFIRRGETLSDPRWPDFGLAGGRTHNNRRWDMRHSIEAWSIDFMHAARALRRAPGFTFVTIVTLVLAIGSNAAIFSVVETVLLDPVKFPAADRLVVIRGTAPGMDLPDEFGPGREFYVQYGEQADMLEDLAMYGLQQTTVRADDQVDRLFVTQATPTMFTTLGVTPLLGRLPVAEDDVGTVIVISHWLWSNWFGSDPEVIGRSYEVSGDMRTVIGVMGPAFRFPDDRTALWVHLAFDEEQEIRPGNFGGNFIGRMKPDITHTELEAQLAVLASRLPERFGGDARYAEIIAAHRPIVRSLEEDLVGDFSKPLWLLLGTVGIVLLIACANVANLFMVRAEGRSRDLGVRQALGAGRAGLVRTQMAEALLLALAGGVGGALLAWVSLPLLVRAAPENIPNLAATRLDAVALGFTAGLALLTALVFGLIPAIRFSRPRFVGALRQTGLGGKPGGDWSRNALVLVQTSSALVLLVGAGLLMRSFWTLSHVDPGYDTENIFSFQVAPQRDDVNDGPSFAQFHQMFAERVAALPGVESVGFVNTLPLDEGAGSRAFFTESAVASGERLPPINFTMASTDYFETMGIDLVRGRGFEPDDHTVGPVNMLVSSAAANLLWPGQDAIGERLSISPDTTFWMTVVGVVEDIFLADFRQDGPDPMMYLPLVGVNARMWGVGSPAYVVKSSRADLLAPEVRALMNEVVPESPMYRVFTMEGLADRSMAQLSFTMLLLALASGLALVLGAVGLYGVLSYVVSDRGREIAVRMALGAESHRVQQMVVLQGARVAAAGVALGLAGAVAGTRVLDSLLFGVGTLDIPTFVVMGTLMLAVALVASYVPARRASLLDPMDSLRAD